MFCAYLLSNAYSSSVEIYRAGQWACANPLLASRQRQMDPTIHACASSTNAPNFIGTIATLHPVEMFYHHADDAYRIGGISNFFFITLFL